MNLKMNTLIKIALKKNQDQLSAANFFTVQSAENFQSAYKNWSSQRVIINRTFGVILSNSSLFCLKKSLFILINLFLIKLIV